MSKGQAKKFTAEELRVVMDRKHNIRNISVVGSVSHGKSTLSDILVDAAGVHDEAGLGITKTSIGISVSYEMTDEFLKNFRGERQGNKYLINLIDSPGHVDFSSEVTAALRISDGALVVVDCIYGVCLQTENVLKQILGEGIRPVLVFSKMDKFILDLEDDDGEYAYQRFQAVIKEANSILLRDNPFGDLPFDPIKGTVAFSAGLYGWAFTLNNFAKIFASKCGLGEAEMLERLWGDNFFDINTKKWTTKITGSTTCKRGFVLFCYHPIKYIINCCMTNQQDVLWSSLQRFGVTTKPDRDLRGEALMKRVMQNWFPASNALLEMVIFHLPSPREAQKYRVRNLYDGPHNDIYAKAIGNCDPEGPLMLHVSKFIPIFNKQQHWFYAFGRVFSGRISRGLGVRIMDPDSVCDKGRYFEEGTILRIAIWMGKTLAPLMNVPCGNTVIILSNSFIPKDATLTYMDAINAHPIRAMRFPASPVVCATVECKVASDSDKLVSGLVLLMHSDLTVQCTFNQSGKHIIACAGEDHLKNCLKDLQEYFTDDVEIDISEPFVSYRETVGKCPMTVNDKVSHKLPLHMEAHRVNVPDLLDYIEEGPITPRNYLKICTKILIKEFDWDKDLPNKIWGFGPLTSHDPNMVLDKCKGLQYPNEIKDSVAEGFREVSKQGALAREPMEGICFEVHDVAVDAFSPEIVEKAFYDAQLRALPRLLEPYYRVEILTTEEALVGVNSVLYKRNGYSYGKLQLLPGFPFYKINAFLPVRQSFGFSVELENETSNRAFSQCLFYCWRTLQSDPLEPNSEAYKLVATIRKRKGLKELTSQLSEYRL